MDNYYFVYNIETKEEFACHQNYYDKHRKELIAIAVGSISELIEFLGNDFLLIDKEEWYIWLKKKNKCYQEL